VVTLEIFEIIDTFGLVTCICGLIWLIRLEGAVKANYKEIKRFGELERRFEAKIYDHDIRISQRDEEMRGIGEGIAELKKRVQAVENSQQSTGETLVRIETKLDFIMGMNKHSQ
jgi:hypothetical protein